MPEFPKDWKTTPSYMPALWFVFGASDQPSLQTCSYSKRGAIKHWVKAAGYDWPYWRRRGFRAHQSDIAWRKRRTI